MTGPHPELFSFKLVFITFLYFSKLIMVGRGLMISRYYHNLQKTQEHIENPRDPDKCQARVKKNITKHPLSVGNAVFRGACGYDIVQQKLLQPKKKWLRVSLVTTFIFTQLPWKVSQESTENRYSQVPPTEATLGSHL